MKKRLTTGALAIAAACTIALPAAVAHADPSGGAANGLLPAPPIFEPSAEPIPADATEYERQFALAEIGLAAAGGEGIHYPNWCFNTQRPPELSDRSELGPAWLMDDAAYVGMVTVGQTVLQTADGGYVLFDTMYNEGDVENLTKPGLVELGLDPAELRAVFVTHGHGDHDGAAADLQDEFGVPVYIGSADAGGKSYSPTLIDSDELDPVDITVGGTTITALSSPGHTPGTVSYILPTTYGGASHPLALWGGSGLPAGASLQNALDYMESAGRMWELIWATGADSSINSHTFFDQSKDRILEIIANGGIEDSNPMIQGNDTVLQSFYVLRQCAASQVAARDEAASNPIWRMTDTDVYAAEFVNAKAQGSASLVAVGARLSNAFEVLEGQEITFTADGASCTSTTDADGVAKCMLNIPATAEVTIEAAYGGQTTAGGDEVDLPSKGSITIAR
ncbi:MBL fold metallo-hydrolase [Agromyces sp. M3QZ16-3]|uniref:MBL fold metallo-hydrolase n=1 Tax=Agromyces sp. M3QZ16-3 TaxID=3447585 RepID=UPI003F690DD7